VKASAFGLRTRLFAWLLAAIVVGMLASSVVWVVVRSEVDAGPMHTMSRALAAEIATTWDDPTATEVTLARMRESTGIDFKVRRDAADLPATVRMHTSSLVFDGGHAFVPVIRNGRVVGAIQFAMAPMPGRPLRQIVFFIVALVVLAIAARSVSARVVRPLERVAEAARRFGDGNLAARTEVDARASHEVREVAHAFDAMATRIERLVRDQRELLAAVSHELRSPLGRARVALELARDQGATVPAIERVDRSLTELDTILGDLLSITRAGLSDIHKQPTALVPFLRKQLAANADDPQLVIDGDEGITAAVDPVLFGRAVTNLVENARHHGGSGEIRVHVEPMGDRIVVSVLDHGSGLPETLIDKAFEPFVRGDAARSHHHSTGLGLAIVRRVIEAHGGSARIRNVEEAGKVVGAEVSIEVPAA
jgi:two-component system, OmpR family, sensor kinase